MGGVVSLMVRWLALRGRGVLQRVLWAAQAGAVVMGAVTVVLAALYGAHLAAGWPEDLGNLPWLQGPVWATAGGLVLRLVVAWIVFDAARAGRRRLSRGRGGG